MHRKNNLMYVKKVYIYIYKILNAKEYYFFIIFLYYCYVNNINKLKLKKIEMDET